MTGSEHIINYIQHKESYTKNERKKIREKIRDKFSRITIAVDLINNL